jgi:sulfopyruvate decarboxylase subunit alpha
VTGVSGVSAARALAVIEDLGFTHVVMIPDGESRHLFDSFGRSSKLEIISPAREGEGVAIAAGLWVGGKKPLLVLQNTGLMEAGDAIRGCGLGPRIPLQMLVGWRGYPGATAGRLPIDSAYPYTEPLLQAWGISYWHLMSDGDLAVLGEMDHAAEQASSPVAALFGWPFQP